MSPFFTRLDEGRETELEEGDLEETDTRKGSAGKERCRLVAPCPLAQKEGLAEGRIA